VYPSSQAQDPDGEQVPLPEHEKGHLEAVNSIWNPAKFKFWSAEKEIIMLLEEEVKGEGRSNPLKEPMRGEEGDSPSWTYKWSHLH